MQGFFTKYSGSKKATMKKQFYAALFLVFVQLTSQAQFLPPYIPDEGDVVAWYPFENNAYDYSGNFRDLVNVNVTFGPDRFGLPDKAAYFNGNAYLTYPSFPNLPSQSKRYTISLWVKPDNITTNAYQSILQLGHRTTGLNDDCVARMYQFADHFNTYNDYTPQVDHSVTCSTYIQNTDWVHLEIEWDGYYFTLLKNGQFEMQSSGTNVNDVVGEFLLGAYGFTGQNLTGFFKGYIDDVVIYYKALPLCSAGEMYRSCGIYYTPVDQTVTVGDTARFHVNNDCYMETGLSYQWRMDNGIGFQNLTNAGQFSGVNTQVLTIANVTAANNNSRFACTITGNCDTQSTDTTWLTVTQPNGIQNIDEDDLRISPNPASSMVTLFVSASLLNMPYHIFNSLGQQVMEGNISSRQTGVDVSAMQTGVYTVQMAGYKPQQLVLKK